MVYCSGCGSGINGSYTTFNGRPYHPECFNCSSCDVSLSNSRFFIINGSVVCYDCQADAGPKCKRCSKPFPAGIHYKVLPDGYYHNECFICDGPCENVLYGSFYTVRNKRICGECFGKYGNNYEKYIKKKEKKVEIEKPKPEPVKPKILVPIYY